MNCSLAHLHLHPYLDGELTAPDALAFEAHLMDCPACRREFDALVATVETVRGAHGVYEAPENSRLHAAELIETHRQHALWRIGAVAAALLAAVMFEFLLTHALAQDVMTELAAESHLRYTRGSLPLDIRSEEPQTVSAWLSSRLPFHLTLPNYPEPPGQAKKYTLEGARLLETGRGEAAYVVYRMDNRPISLLMTTSPGIVPTGGEIYYSGGLAFHTNVCKGLRVITWADKGLNYALVSDLATEGAQSCKVCHGSEQDDRKLAPLSPRL